MRSAAAHNPVSEAAPHDLRARRRAARRAENRTEILDAAERVFGEHGVRDGSLREIALLSGFSTGAIYLFFDNKQHLLSETLIRRGAELVEALRAAAADVDASALDKLHRIVDVTVAFFEARPDFRRLLRHLTGGTAIVGPTLAAYDDNDGHLTQAMTLLAGVVADGQKSREIRAGNPQAIAHLYSVLINEHVLLATRNESDGGTLTRKQFHALIDGMLRNA
jgi:AcrR family transcriptional regulator